MDETGNGKKRIKWGRVEKTRIKNEVSGRWEASSRRVTAKFTHCMQVPWEGDRRMSCHRGHKRVSERTNMSKVWGITPTSQNASIEFQEGIKFKKSFPARNHFCFFPSLSWAQAAFPAYTFSFLSASWLPWKLHGWWEPGCAICWACNSEIPSPLSGRELRSYHLMEFSGLCNGLNDVPQNSCPPRTLKCDLIWR